jgi:hypothetical protein
MRVTYSAGCVARAVLIGTLAVSPAVCARTVAEAGDPGPAPSAAAEREGLPSWAWVVIGAAAMLLLVVATADVEGPEADYNPYDSAGWTRLNPYRRAAQRHFSAASPIFRSSPPIFSSDLLPAPPKALRFSDLLPTILSLCPNDIVTLRTAPK